MPAVAMFRARWRLCRRRRGSGRCASGTRHCRWVVVGLAVIVLVGRFVVVVTAGASAVPVLVGGLVLLKVEMGMSTAGVVELDFVVERIFAGVGPDTTELSFGSTGGLGLIVVVMTFGISK